MEDQVNEQLEDAAREVVELTKDEIESCANGVTPEVQEKIDRLVARFKAKQEGVLLQ
jgi:hypothetical protein